METDVWMWFALNPGIQEGIPTVRASPSLATEGEEKEDTPNESHTYDLCYWRDAAVCHKASGLECWAREQELMAALFSFRFPQGSLG